MKTPHIAPMLLTSLVLTGCASLSITDDKIAERTALALGLNAGSFTVHDRQDEATSTRYLVKTKGGEQYNCTVGGFISLFGRVVSDAICTKRGEPARNPLIR